jgi:hypothetical protein
MLVVRPIVWNLVLKTIERCGPKFHAVQILTQPLERFDQISNDGICWRFRHYDAPNPTRRFLFFLG